MYKFQTVIKNGVLSLFAAAIFLLFSGSRADAASYTYNLTSYAGVTGSITTSCDTCTLNASNITAWSLTAPGVFSIASTAPGAQVSAPAGNTGMQATPEVINFNFGGGFGGITFSGSSGSIAYVSGQPTFQRQGTGHVAVCSSNTSCSFALDTSDSYPVASASAPFPGSVVYTFTGRVTSATGIYASAGTAVGGTFTLNLDAGDAALPVSLTTPWSSSSTGTSQLVVSTLNSGSVTFSDAGSTSSKTTVAGLANTGSSAPNEYFASDTEFSGATKSVQHSFQIVGGTSAKAPFNSSGLPVLQNGTGTGTLLATAGNATVGQLNYTITSLTAAPTTLSISPARLVFPSTLINTKSAPLPVTITNTSPNDVTFYSISLSDVFGPPYQITADNCVPVLHAKASCTVSIIFTPNDASGGNTVLIVADDAQGSPQEIGVAGDVTLLPAPFPALTTTAVSFAGQQVGTTSAEQFITLKNTGNAPLTIFSIGLVPSPAGISAGYQPGDFTLRNACVPTLAPGRACTVFVSFTPVAAGLATADILISDNVLTGFYSDNLFGQFISLSGNGSTVPVPGLTFNIPSLTFANQVTGTTSVKQAFDLTNMGTVPLNISSIALSGSQKSDFVLQNACASTLPAGQHCAVFVTFKPSTAGKLSAAVVVTSNGGGVVSLPLFGTATPATAPVLKLSASALGFGVPPYPTLAVDLTNTGTAPLSLSSIAIIGELGYQDYFTLRNDCVSVLAPGKLCAVFITFNPPSTATSRTGRIDATLVINDNEQVLQQSVQLEGIVPCSVTVGC